MDKFINFITELGYRQLVFGALMITELAVAGMLAKAAGARREERTVRAICRESRKIQLKPRNRQRPRRRVPSGRCSSCSK